MTTFAVRTKSITKDRTEAWKAYDTLYNEAVTAWQEGKKIVIVAEGDAGALAGLHIVKQEEQINAQLQAGASGTIRPYILLLHKNMFTFVFHLN